MSSLDLVIVGQIQDNIERADRILLHLHPYSDPDAVGSALAMRRMLINKGKQVTLIQGDHSPPQNLDFLSGFDQIQEKGFTEVNIDDFDLFICLDSPSPSRVTDQIELKFPLEIPTIVIDHHKDNIEFGEVNLVRTDISSASEILFHLFRQLGWEIDAEIAEALYTGIFADTGGFRNSLTQISTYHVAGDLVQLGADPIRVAFHLSSQSNLELRVAGKAMAEMEEYLNGDVTIVNPQRIDRTGDELEEQKFKGVINNLKFTLSNSSTLAVAVIIYQVDESTVSVSLRANNPSKPVDVSKVAHALGGGGHEKASAIKFENTSINEIKKRLIDEIKKQVPTSADKKKDD